MASSINASTTAGVVTTADTSGVLNIQTAGTTAISIDASQAVSFTNAPTVTGGTANGVAYLNGSKVLTTGTALTFDGTNIAAAGLATFGSAVIGLASANTDLRVVRTLGLPTFYAGVKQSGQGAYFLGNKSDTLVIDSDPTNETAGSNIAFNVDGSEKARIPATGGIQSVTTISVGNATPSTSGAGITFPATQSASSDANTLDDYEEGTWTPVITGASYTASTTAGTYTKIGRLVYCRFNITFSAVSGSSNSSCTFSGFPFNAGAATPGVVREDTSTGTIYVVYIDGGASTGALNSYSGVANGSARTLRTSESYICSITYQTS